MPAALSIVTPHNRRPSAAPVLTLTAPTGAANVPSRPRSACFPGYVGLLRILLFLIAFDQHRRVDARVHCQTDDAAARFKQRRGSDHWGARFRGCPRSFFPTRRLGVLGFCSASIERAALSIHCCPNRSFLGPPTP